MNKITDYQLVGRQVMGDLNTEVNRLISEGWQVYGNPFVNAPFYCQALVKYK